MGRKSKLTEQQWQNVQRRVLAGEPYRKLAREFGISEAAIRQREGSRVEKIKTVAGQLVAADKALRELPIASQHAAKTLADRLIVLGDNLLSAATHGAATAHRLTALANSEVAKVDDANPLGSIESLKSVGVLTKLANDSAAIGLNLLNANRDRLKDDAGGDNSYEQALRSLIEGPK